jgi:hypothetical protein
MADVGTIAKAINSKKMELYIGTTSNKWPLLQNARMLISHPIIREPTTAGGVDLFTGAPDVSISGSLLFTSDEWANATSNDFVALTAVSASTGEVPESTWGMLFTSKDASSTDLSASGKVSVVDISKSVEGGVKVDVSIILKSIPA